MPLNFRALILILAALATTSGTGGAAEWVVSKVNPPAQYSADSETWHPLSAGAAVPDRSWVRTGERGMLLLEREAESILLKPGSLAEIASEFDGRAGTSIRQRSGALLLDVRTRELAHTQVQTPFLAAVVKGTKFESRVGRWDAELEVQRGVVEVTHIRRGERIDLVAGQTARVGGAAALPIVFFGTSGKPEAERVSPGEPIVRPLDGGDMPAGWGTNRSERAWLWLGGVSRAGVVIAVATLAALVLATLILIKRQKTAASRGWTGPPEASFADASQERRPQSPSDSGSLGGGSLMTGLVAIFSACIVGLVAVAMPGSSPTQVLAAMILALFVMLLIIKLVPSGKGS